MNKVKNAIANIMGFIKKRSPVVIVVGAVLILGIIAGAAVVINSSLRVADVPQDTVVFDEPIATVSAPADTSETTVAPPPSTAPAPASTQPPTPTPTPEPTPEPAPGPDPTPTTYPDNFVFPKENLRPFAVMIDNEGLRPFPQGGLEYAQLVYEAIVEGGATRLMAVFWYDYGFGGDSEDEGNAGDAGAGSTGDAGSGGAGSSPSGSSDGDKPGSRDSSNNKIDIKLIGPVRSARHYFLNFEKEHDAIYIHIGQSPQADRDFSVLKVDHINGVGGVFWDITPNKNNWQDSYTSTERLFSHIERRNMRITTDIEPALTYSLEPVILESGEDADEVRITYIKNFTNTAYKFDEETGLYLRYRNGNPQMARETTANNDSSRQLTAKNVLVQSVRNWSIDNEDRQDMNDVGSGEGYYITNGKAEKIKWSKSARTAQTKFTYLSGEPVLLNPGQTYIQIVPTSGSVVFE